MKKPKKQKAVNRAFAINLLMIVAGLLALTFASSKFYKLYCAYTGAGGTTQVAQILPDVIIDRDVKVSFDTNMDHNLGWVFKSEQDFVKTKVGQNSLAYFHVENNSGEDSFGMATFNVTPEKAGKYFNKVQCFCFDKQLLKAGQKMQFPVSFFIAPEFASDPYMDDVSEITLSYTFYRQ